VANIAVTTMELLRDSSPSAEVLVRDSLAGALAERMDIDFVDPTKAAAANVSPASITNGVAPITSVGRGAVEIRLDIKALFETFIAANNAPTSGVWIMSSVTALALSLLVNPLGQPEFPGVNMNGGVLYGLPVITSQYVPTDTAGGYVFLVNASDIYFADEGGVEVDMSTEASLNMVDNPTQASDSPPVPTQVVSLWQTNSVGFRAERTVNWSKRRPSAVAVLDGVNWGDTTSP
jgi:HK97 family phage major capsid protein